MPWEIQNFITDFLRCHGCEVTRRNQQVIAAAIEARVRRRPVCHAYLNALLEEDVVFDMTVSLEFPLPKGERE